MCEQADLIAEKLGVADFKANSGWLTRFKHRHGIVFKTACGESASVDTASVENWKKTAFITLLDTFSPQDIFNADETGLFYRCLLNKTHTFKGESCHGDKQFKERLTVLVAANMTGTEAIGKSANPRCFKNVKSKPVEYVYNTKAWMTADIFERWLRKLERMYLLQGRTIALVIDNCPAHPKISDLKAVHLQFLPPNTTSHTQPCDQGIINSFKHHYRTKIVRQYLSSLNDSISQERASTFHVSILDALYSMRWAWNMVSAETMSNCFRHAGFQKTEETTPPHVQCEPQCQELGNLFEWLSIILPLDTVPEDYIVIDQNIEVSGEVTLDAIVADVMGTPDAESDEEDAAPSAAVSSHEAIAAIKTLRCFAQHPESVSLFDIIASAENSVYKIIPGIQKQTTISDFFKSKYVPTSP